MGKGNATHHRAMAAALHKCLALPTSVLALRSPSAFYYAIFLQVRVSSHRMCKEIRMSGLWMCLGWNARG